MSPLSSAEINRCMAHGERLARVEERLDDQGSKIVKIEIRIDKVLASRWDKAKFTAGLIMTFLGSGTGLYLLGKLLGSK